MAVLEINWSPALKKEVLKRADCKIDHHTERKDYCRIWFPDGFSLLVADFGLGRAPMIASEIGKADAEMYRTIEDLALLHLPSKLINSIAKDAATELNEPFQPFYPDASNQEKNGSTRDLAYS